MSIATIGALCIGFLPGAETQFPEAVFVMLFFQVGELFRGHSRRQEPQVNLGIDGHKTGHGQC